MRMAGSEIELSASDLSGFLSCIHLTASDLAVAQGKREPRPGSTQSLPLGGTLGRDDGVPLTALLA